MSIGFDEPRRFRVHGTGHDDILPEELHRGTCVVGSLVLHVFEVI